MRLIDADKYIEEESEGTFLGDISIEKFNEITPTVKAYTKDKVIAILTELRLEIEEKSYYDTTIIGNYEDEVRIGLVELDDVNDIIQEKINSLKEDKNEI